MQEKKYISWDEFHGDAIGLAHDLREKGPWQGMMTITRGGLAPSAILSHELGLRLIETICAKSYVQDGEQGQLNIIKSAIPTQDGAGWLVIDDLADTGETLKCVRAMYPKAHIAVVYAKPKGASLTDSYFKKVNQDVWLVFPWEVKI